MTPPIVNDTNGAILQIVYPYFKNAELVEIFNFSEGSIRRLVNKYIDTPHTRSEVLAMKKYREIPYEVYRAVLAIAEKFGGQVPELLQCEDLIRSGLRNNPDWFIISEVREMEPEALLSAALTPHSITTTTTTLHATDLANIPSRLKDMEAQFGYAGESTTMTCL